MRKINLFRFCQEKKEIIEKYVYAEQKIQLINDPKFIMKIQKQEDEFKPKPYVLKSYQFPFLLNAATAFVSHLWQVVPYKLIFKHATISDYTKELIYPIIISPLGHQSFQSFCTYFPILPYTMLLNGKFIGTWKMVFLFFSNAILSSLITYLYESYRNEKLGIQMITPKTTGACTSLAFAGCFAALSPTHMIFVILFKIIFFLKKKIPFIVIPICFGIYEIEEFVREDEENCRLAHIISLLYGIAFGLILRV